MPPPHRIRDLSLLLCLLLFFDTFCPVMAVEGEGTACRNVRSRVVKFEDIPEFSSPPTPYAGLTWGPPTDPSCSSTTPSWTILRAGHNPRNVPLLAPSGSNIAISPFPAPGGLYLPTTTPSPEDGGGGGGGMAIGFTLKSFWFACLAQDLYYHFYAVNCTVEVTATRFDMVVGLKVGGNVTSKGPWRFSGGNGGVDGGFVNMTKVGGVDLEAEELFFWVREAEVGIGFLALDNVALNMQYEC